MPASYPSAAKSFTPVVDGVDYPQAADINQAYDEITAIEQALLAGFAQHILFAPDGTYDIGQSGANRPRDLYLSRDAFIGRHLRVSGNTILDGTLSVAGALTLLSTLIANGRTYTFPASETPGFFLRTDGSGGLTWSAPSSVIGSSLYSCGVFHSAVQALANNTPAAVLFDSEDFDNGALHDTASNSSRLVNSSGATNRFLVTAQIVHTPNGAGVRQAYLRKNGTTSVSGLVATGGVSAVPIALTLSAMVTLAAGDYVEIITLQSSGGAGNLGHATTRELQCSAQMAVLP